MTEANNIRLLLSTSLFDPITAVEVCDANGAICVGSASGTVRVLAESSCVVLCRRAEEAIGSIRLSPTEVLVSVGDIGLKRWTLPNLKPETPAFAGAVHDNIPFPFAHSYGNCAASTCFISGQRLLVSRGERDLIMVQFDSEGKAGFEVVPLGPERFNTCWPVAFDGDRVVLFTNRRRLHVYANYNLAWEFELERPTSLGAMRLMEDRLVGLCEGRLVLWNLTAAPAKRQIGPHLHGWRKKVLHFCLEGSGIAHVVLATLGSDASICLFEGALDALVFSKRIPLGFARFHLNLPYFMRLVNQETLVFNDDCGLYLLSVS